MSNVAQTVSTCVAVYAVITFERRMNERLKEHKSFFKLVSFKGVVILQSAQAFIFPALAKAQVFFPTPPYHISYHDFAVGIPTFLVIWEMLAVAVMFLWSFYFESYQLAARQGVMCCMVGSLILVKSSLRPLDSTMPYQRLSLMHPQSGLTK